MSGPPNLTYGQVPTAGQWNSYFSQKQDTLGYTPVNRAGDTMFGKLTMLASSTSLAGFNIPPGTAPSSPEDGDIWVTNTGLFAQISGSTIGPIRNGNVAGPEVAVVDNLASFADTSGGLIKDSGISSNSIVLNTRQIEAGTGLTGGGPLSSDVTIGLNSSSIASLTLADSALQPSDIGVSVAPIDQGMTFPTIQDVTALPALPAGASVVHVGGTVTVGDGGAGMFTLLLGDYTAAVAADPAQGIFFVPPGMTASQGILKRQYDADISSDWFTSSIGGDYAVAINRALTTAAFLNERSVAVPPGVHNVATTISITVAGSRLHGFGSGAGGSTGTSNFKFTPTALNWTGGTNTDMISINPAATNICWGVQIDNMSLFGNQTIGVNGINGNQFTAKALFTNLELNGLNNGYECSAAGNGDTYALRFTNVVFTDCANYGAYLPSKNHNTLFTGCEFAFPYDGTRIALAAVYMKGSVGSVFTGCDIEPGWAPYFLHLVGTSGTLVSGGYFEARNANTLAFIRVGDDSIGTAARCLGVDIIGAIFDGGGFVGSVVQIESQSSGIVLGDGCQANGIVTSIVNNVTAGNTNKLGNFWKTPATAFFSGTGGSNGFLSSSRVRDAGQAGFTTPTSVLTIAYYMKNPRADRTVTAIIRYSIADGTASNTNSIFQLRYSLDGTTYVNLGDIARAGMTVNSGTGDTVLGTLTIQEVDAQDRNPFDTIWYQLLITPGSGDTVTLLAGSSLAVQEAEY